MKNVFWLAVFIMLGGVVTAQSYNKITGKQDFTDSIKFSKYIDLTGDSVLTVDPVTHKLKFKLSGGGGEVVTGGVVLHLPVTGENYGTNIGSASWINNAFFITPPTASLTGGGNFELTSTASSSQTLNWSAGRQSATTPLSSIVVAGVTQSFTQPAQPGTVSGTQNVTVTSNVSTTYSNVVTSSDGKTATATTTFSYLPKRYWFYSSNAAPTSADVVADLGGSAEFSTTRAKSNQFVVTVTGVSKYVTYAYPASFGALTSIIVSGLESIGAFNQTTVSVTNASGYVQNYYLYTTQNIFQNTTITFISVE